jgi:hypothetical protein
MRFCVGLLTFNQQVQHNSLQPGSMVFAFGEETPTQKKSYRLVKKVGEGAFGELITNLGL